MQAHKNRVAGRRQLSIFLADDSVDTVLTLSALLRDEGYFVHTCADPRLAMEGIKQYSPDVCILDVVMPVKSGYQLAREIRAARLRPEPVLIAISALFTKPSDQLLARSVGFDHFVPKGADTGELLRTLREVAAPGGFPSAA